MTFRIYRSSTPDAIVLALSGDMDQEHAARLQESLGDEKESRVILDLQEITLVDRAAVHFLAGAESAGIRIVNCPVYVRSWIVAERESQAPRTEELNQQEPQR